MNVNFEEMDEDADWTPDTEYEEQDDIECEEDTDVPNKINKWKNTSFLSPEQEEDLVEWIRENDIFYNKGRRNSAKKDQLWADKAAELNVPGKPGCLLPINLSHRTDSPPY